MRPVKTLSLMLAAISAGCLIQTARANDELAVQGSALIEKYCYGCHGVNFNGDAALNVMDRKSLLNPDQGYVVEGNLDESYLWTRISDGDMPPESSDLQPTDAEREIMKQWIQAGAPFIQREERPFVTRKAVMQSLYDDILRMPEEVRPYVRYFDLTHLHNNYQGVKADDLALYKAALSKSINSVSWEPQIVVPTPLNEEQTLFRIDLRDYGWTGEHWRMMLKHYPYGVHYRNSPDAELAQLDETISKLAHSDVCVIRADWFTARAMRPPLYNQLLRLPPTVGELESMLRVDPIEDFVKDRLRRAGFVKSGVSQANRVVDRHSCSTGYYWKSYDFGKEGTRGNIMRLPLGPDYPGHPYPHTAFEADGGEMIFSLPNGLQGYYLATATGEKLDRGPISVVRDKTETGGTPEVINGISCMNCHRHGMIDFTDEVRVGAGAFGEVRRKVQTLYAEPKAMQRIVEGDRSRFLRSFEAACGQFLRVGTHTDWPIERFAEPCGAIARFYEQRLSAEEVAYELGLEDPALLKGAIQANPRLRQLGLGPLVQDAPISRAEWERQSDVISPLQVVLQTLDIATPMIILDD